ncbi:MAG: metal-dependent transcriptional regulator [Methanomicrobiaceae archaeon]|uniref:Iron-dependent repressor ider/dtxr n=1 Tax=hydrocarbon metagenome TaxID=938273 RepID=A0A0W8FIL3_9ZZZZ|nr:metal-dependent transcriptional regulator [Methanomicrobiaceae archaeon]MDD5418386.1 metal-dependent transcriptional regulator [Methanomicrobiaceae archaeon]
MHSSIREDYLEAILRITSAGNAPATSGDVARELQADAATVERNIAALVMEGYLTEHDGRFDLTESGRELAGRVTRKHQVLQCFLTEMLGIDEDAASREACTLEHEISDETIDRLSSYIDRHHPPAPPGWRWRAASTLLDFNEGDMLRVIRIRAPGRNRRLMHLGILPGEQVQIRRKLRNHAVVVRVKGCDVAISPEIAASILVEKTG